MKKNVPDSPLGKLYNEHIDFIIAHNVEGLLNQYAPDCVLISSMTPDKQPLYVRGHKELEEFFRSRIFTLKDLTTDIAFWALAGDDGQAVEAVGSGEFMGVPREKARDFLLGNVAPQEMPVAFKVAHSFDVDVTLSTGNKNKVVSGENELIITGELGRIRVNRGSLKGKPVEDIDADPAAKKEIEDLMVKVYGGELPASHMTNFFDCVKSGKQPVANVREHVRAVNATHLANIALLTGRTVKFDPQTQTFANDAEANQLTKRTRRAGYDITV